MLGAVPVHPLPLPASLPGSLPASLPSTPRRHRHDIESFWLPTSHAPLSLAPEVWRPPSTAAVGVAGGILTQAPVRQVGHPAPAPAPAPAAPAPFLSLNPHKAVPPVHDTHTNTILASSLPAMGLSPAQAATPTHADKELAVPNGHPFAPLAPVTQHATHLPAHALVANQGTKRYSTGICPRTLTRKLARLANGIGARGWTGMSRIHWVGGEDEAAVEEDAGETEPTFAATPHSHYPRTPYPAHLSHTPWTPTPHSLTSAPPSPHRTRSPAPPSPQPPVTPTPSMRDVIVGFGPLQD